MFLADFLNVPVAEKLWLASAVLMGKENIIITDVNSIFIETPAHIQKL